MTDAAARPDVSARPVPGWTRLALVHLLQLPAVALLILAGERDSAWWCAGLWGSLVACAGTDSGWRWRNRLLVSEAVCWLVLALARV